MSDNKHLEKSKGHLELSFDINKYGVIKLRELTEDELTQVSGGKNEPSELNVICGFPCLNRAQSI